MTQLDFAFVLGTTQQAANQLAIGRRGLSAATAKDVGAAFGVSPEYLLKLQKASEIDGELSRARDPDSSIARRAGLMANYPVREMVRRGWLKQGPESLESQMAGLFGVPSLDKAPGFEGAAKRSASVKGDEPPPAQLAWLYRVRQIAGRLVVPPYSEKKLRDSLPNLRKLLIDPRNVGLIPRIMREHGIRFVLVESLPGGLIDGVTFWLDEGRSPVIGMSLRFDRIDNVWFVWRHEIEHVLRRHGLRSPMIDSDLKTESAGTAADIPEEEQQANEAAADFCIPKSKMDSWIARKAPLFSRDDLVSFASVQQVHPGIAVGQFRNRTGRHSLFSQFLVKIRTHLTSSDAAYDGWGHSYPV